MNNGAGIAWGSGESWEEGVQGGKNQNNCNSNNLYNIV